MCERERSSEKKREKKTNKKSKKKLRMFMSTGEGEGVVLESKTGAQFTSRALPPLHHAGCPFLDVAELIVTSG